MSMEIPKSVLARKDPPQPGVEWTNLATPAIGSGAHFLRSYIAVIEVNAEAVRKGATSKPYVNAIAPSMQGRDALFAYPPEDPQRNSWISTLERAAGAAWSGVPTVVRRLDGNNFDEEDFSDVNVAFSKHQEFADEMHSEMFPYSREKGWTDTTKEKVESGKKAWLEYAELHTEGVLSKALEEAASLTSQDESIPAELGQTIVSWSVALGHSPWPNGP